MKRSPNLQDPGARAPGQIKKRKRKLQASSAKLQAPAGTAGLSLNTIKKYK